MNFMSFATCLLVNFGVRLDSGSWMDLGTDGGLFAKHPGRLKREPS